MAAGQANQPSSSTPRSMTGFGAARLEQGGVTAEGEIRSTNSRFLDLTVKLPRAWSSFEPEIRDLVSGELLRGRVEVYLERRGTSGEAGSVEFRRPLFDAALTVYRGVLAEFQCDSPEARARAIGDILSRREILNVSEGEPDLSAERSIVLDVVRRALEQLVAMRRTEGARLAEDVRGRLRTLEEVRVAVAAGAARSPEELRDRLLARIARLAPAVTLDESRYAAEVALLADRLDVTEEVVRIESHLAQFTVTLGQPPVGRKLEFLLQELGREFNTIGSKAQDATVQGLIVTAKTELERIREQIQNME